MSGSSPAVAAPIVPVQAEPSEPALLSCPFCGSEHGPMHASAPPAFRVVFCAECGTQTPGAFTRVKAAQQWNRRPADPVRADLLGALKSFLDFYDEGRIPTRAALTEAEAAIAKAEGR
jgi:Lar family restriction alleviation protein